MRSTSTTPGPSEVKRDVNAVRSGGAAEPTARAAPIDEPAAQQPAGPSVPSATAPKEHGHDPLLAAICHDLRAPLAAVTMGANFVLQTTPEGEDGRSRRVLQAILRSCKQMERIVRDFGDLSEIEGDAVHLRLGVHDPGEMLEIAAEAARVGARARNIDIVVVRPDEPLLVRADRDRVHRALAHLIDNAARFAPDGSTVTVAVAEKDADIRFTVTDRGVGLSEETRANLYDRTWHAKRADRVGAGLGLAIVRGFAEAHGGWVDVESKPGLTAFTLALPKDARPSNPPSPPDSNEVRAGRRS